MLIVTVAGTLSLHFRDRRVDSDDLGGRQLRLALAMLVLERAGPVALERLADEVWPGVVPAQWRVATRGLVTQVRRVLDRVGIDGREAIRSAGGAYAVRLPPTVVDVERAAAEIACARAAAAIGDHARASDHAGAARSVVSRPVLPGVDSPWVDEQRARALRLRVESLSLIGTSRTALGAANDAVTALREATTLAPYDEQVWRDLMCAYATAGSIAEALTAYGALRTRLADELGVDPSPETRDLHMQLARSASAAPVPPLRRAPPDRGRPPFRGLAAFDTGDAALFFGREAETQALIDRLRDHSAVAVVGASGCGKSSLVRAGLLPALQHGAITDADTWRLLVVVPGARPVEALGTSLSELLPDARVEDLRTRLERSTTGLADIAGDVCDGSGRTVPVVLVIDQLEELFTVCSDADEAMQFVTLVHDALHAPGGRLKVIVTLRADFYGQATELPPLARLLSTSQLALGALHGDGLEAAVTGPAARCGVTVEPGLVGLVVAEVTGQPGGLPLLQHALLQTWQHRHDDTLTKAAYQAIGGVTGALARHADTVLTALRADEQAAARRILLRAVQPGTGDTPDSRRRIPAAELVTDPVDGHVATAVADRLVEERLLTSTRDPVDGRPAVELAHEALIDGWPRLRAWVDVERALLRAARRVAPAARAWADGDISPDDRLATSGVAKQLLEAAHRLLTPTERAYVQACLDHADRAASLRRRQRVAATAALCLTLAVVSTLAIVATVQRSRAEDRERVARAQALAGSSAAQLDVDPDLALHLALAAVEATPDAGQPVRAAVEALHRAVLHHRIVQVLPDGGPRVAMLGPDTVITAATVDAPAAVRDVATGTRRRTFPRSAGPPSAAAASADGRLYVEVGSDGSVQGWATDSGALLMSTPPVGDAPHALAVSADGTTVAVGGVGQRHGPAVAVIDVEAGDTRATIPLPAPATGLDVASDGAAVAITTFADTTVRVADVLTGALIDEVVVPVPGDAPPGGHLSDVAWIPGDRRLAVGTANPPGIHLLPRDSGQDTEVVDLAPWGVMGPSLCVDATSGAVVATMAGEALVVVDAASGRVTQEIPALRQATPSSCGPDGLVATAEVDGATRVWDTATPPTEVWSASTPPPWTAVWAGDRVISTHRDRSVRSWDSRTGASLRVAGNAFSPASAYIESDPTGDVVATNVAPEPGLPDQSFPLRLRDPITLRANDEPALHGVPLDISADGLLVTGEPGTIRVHTAASGDHVASVSTADPDQIENGVVLPDGRHLVVTAAFEPVTEIIDLQTMEVVAQVCTRGGARPVAVSPDGRLLALSESGPRTTVFDLPALLETGVVAGVSCDDPGHPTHAAQRTAVDAEGVLGLEFSPDSRLLAIAGGFGRILTVVDVVAGEPVLRIEHDGGVGGGRFSPDGRHLAVTVDNRTAPGGSVRVYTLDIEELKAIALQRLRRDLTIEECREHLDGVCPPRRTSG